MTIDETKLNEFMGKVVGDMGGAISCANVLLGDQLGLYKALDRDGAMTPAMLASATSTHERYVREWAANQAAGGYLTYDPKNGTYALPPEHAMALAREDSPVFVAGGMLLLRAVWAATEKLAPRFKSGEGLGWDEHDPSLFLGTERFFRPGYAANLTTSWIPALEGVREKLERGAKVADIGCGHGASTIVMAKAYPKSKFFGFDYHGPSIEIARQRAKEAGVADRVTFETAKSTDFPGNDYDFICHFDCLHDMGDPVGAAKRVHSALAKDGTWMFVEPFAHDKVEDNLNPIGRIFYGASTFICVPASLKQNGPALGAQAGEGRLREVALAGGFKTVRRATETPFNLILEARK